MIITAKTLDEAYKKATSTFNCSIVELEIDVIQHPSSGFLGFMKKEAIIEIKVGKEQTKPQKKAKVKQQKSSYQGKQDVELVSSDKVEKEVKEGISNLLKASCYNLEVKDVTVDEDVVSISIDGADAALMIGKEGYRYKALSYILHNWIKLKYNRSISLEVAEFLKVQKDNVLKYLEIVKEKVSEYGRAQTKPLDGILVKIALEELRRVYPDMYVAIKTLRDGRKVVVVNEHRRKA